MHASFLCAVATNALDLNGHIHGDGCGHPAVEHGDHHDFLVNDELHHVSDSCCPHGCCTGPIVVSHGLASTLKHRRTSQATAQERAGLLLHEDASVGGGSRGVLAVEAGGVETPLLQTTRARDAVAAVLMLRPETAKLAATGEAVPVGDVAPGTEVLVPPGESVPLDGTVLAGESAVEESLLTGESAPVARGPGAAVHAGTVNVGATTLLIRTTAAAGDTAVARMAALAASEQSPAEALVAKFARIYTPVILVSCALLAFLPWAWVAPEDRGDWVYLSLQVLVTACPCALVLSTPATVVCALARAAGKGVLIKSGAALEALRRVSVVSFDKTGTLTRGSFQVVACQPAAGWSARDLLRLLGSLERGSSHPLAAAVLGYAAAQGAVCDAAVDGLEVVPGAGLVAMVEGWRVAAGTAGLLELHAGVSGPEVAAAQRAVDAEGATACLVAVDGRFAGWLSAGRRPRAWVAHVGDGVNDAPALAAADAGIAMGMAGSAAALEAGSVALFTNDVRAVPAALLLARAAGATIWQNIGFAVVTKVAVLVPAAMGRFTLWGAVLVDVGSSLLVVANALRLLKWRWPVSKPVAAKKDCCTSGSCSAAPAAAAACHSQGPECGTKCSTGGDSHSHSNSCHDHSSERPAAKAPSCCSAGKCGSAAPAPKPAGCSRSIGYSHSHTQTPALAEQPPAKVASCCSAGKYGSAAAAPTPTPAPAEQPAAKGPSCCSAGKCGSAAPAPKPAGCGSSTGHSHSHTQTPALAEQPPAKAPSCCSAGKCSSAAAIPTPTPAPAVLPAAKAPSCCSAGKCSLAAPAPADAHAHSQTAAGSHACSHSHDV
ncbi:hypothetical protein CHLNCDRAFT_140903 [Chlorella variabilis]|uniref:P-type ATPase A domain-containing protein n=1 Tax=Chlorella variabilis TaxID=554065 RepID=E1Z6H2_CHLVA|nr:hypothetical protein CHLNCDRAFT_140903 [Chlorella variabilis]EFN58930.1 hypothetical protein CHLNCDRAFT_140903 [Chlorella variabilis]|eukprot:XP_005851032.1 hypothetical protein CHLNCDRAFT_140903 [Chlorella variabilis]